MIEADNGVLQDDLRDMLRALGLFDGPRSQSPHEIFRECIEHVKLLVAPHRNAPDVNLTADLPDEAIRAIEYSVGRLRDLVAAALVGRVAFTRDGRQATIGGVDLCGDGFRCLVGIDGLASYVPLADLSLTSPAGAAERPPAAPVPAPAGGG